MIQKEHRLKKNRHFSYIYKKGKTEFGKYLNLIYIKTKFQPFKVGFSVSNKIGKAHIRNKVKRRLRESFRQILNIVNPNFNYIIVAKVGIESQSQADLKKQLCLILKKASLLNE